MSSKECFEDWLSNLEVSLLFRIEEVKLMDSYKTTINFIRRAIQASDASH